jgi:hypothetical protein
VADKTDVVAVGLLTARDLDILGAGFRRAYPIEDTPVFLDLLDAIDAADRKRAARPRRER